MNKKKIDTICEMALGSRQLLLLHRKFSTSLSNPRISVGSILQRNPILMWSRSDFDKAYQRYIYLVQEREEGRSDMKLVSSSDDNSSAKKSLIEHHEFSPFERLDAAKLSDQDKYKNLNCILSSPNRLPHEKLYFVIKCHDSNSWNFPNSPAVDHTVPLHRISEQLLTNVCGKELDAYNVSKIPIATSFDKSSNIQVCISIIFSFEINVY